MEIILKGICGCCTTMGSNAQIEFNECGRDMKIKIDSHDIAEIKISKEDLKKILSIL